MRRFFLILLLFVLPLQMSWAAASAYCLHEEGKAAQHLGHHSHQHKAAADQPSDADQSSGKSAKGQPHSDCNVCHGIGHAWLPAGSSLPVGDTASVNADSSPFFYASHIPDAPKRPDWSSAI